jgi:hypothetical protein
VSAHNGGGRPSIVRAQVLVTGGIGLVLLIALWPLPARAVRLLERWGVAEPDGHETNEALRYLKRRRVLYPALYVAISVATSLYLPAGAEVLSTALASLLVGGLLAEIAALPPRRATNQEASPDQRRVRDLVPVWSIWTAGVLLAGLVAMVAVTAVGSGRVLPSPWWALLLGFGAAATGIAIVWLAVRRPPTRPNRAVEALRLRSARVGVGLAMAALGAIAASGGAVVGVALGVLGIVGWLATTAPVRPPARVHM